MGVGSESPGQLWWTGEHERAIRAAERDLAIGASFGNFGMRIVSTCRLGQALHATGEYQRAAELFRQAVGSLTGELVHERFGMAALVSVWARSWLCLCLAERGEFEEAIAVGEEAAALADSADDPYSRGQAAFGLGMVLVIQERAEAAMAVLEQGLVVARVRNLAFLVPFLTGPLGAACALDGRPDRATALLEQTVEQAVSVGLVAHHALRLVWLGHAHLLAGRTDAALDVARRALRLAEEHKERGHAAYARRLLGDALARGGDPAAADEEYGHALGLAERLGMQPLAARCRDRLARPRT
jgi:tetratricopeptide (TPR) repeat protein